MGLEAGFFPLRHLAVSDDGHMEHLAPAPRLAVSVHCYEVGVSGIQQE